MTKLDSIFNYLRIFQGPKDIVRFRALYKNKLHTDENLISLRLKEVRNHELLCRPNTTDAQVLWDTFYRRYHVPSLPLPKDAVIVDLGANVGYTMAHFAYLYPDSLIYGVEMDYSNFLLAQKNLAMLTNQCKLIHAAVWHENGKINYTGDQAWGFKIDYEKTMNMSEGGTPAKTLDTIFKEFGLDKVDYIKMDIEGAEKFVLENAEKWIDRVKMLKIEIHPPATINESLKILERYGFLVKKDMCHPSAITAIKN